MSDVYFFYEFWDFWHRLQVVETISPATGQKNENLCVTVFGT